ncbi:MAG TPA: hypothetical protein VFO34_09180 [Candidatus Acidoferrales bacterium]|nr:hypothetical protein [Candidatus Acidoferrales bacterium]
MEALKDKFSLLAERIRQASDHESLIKAVDEMTAFLSAEKNRLAIALPKQTQAAKSSK